jgi:lambda repressor-like predicted transcriptional regulator
MRGISRRVWRRPCSRTDSAQFHLLATLFAVNAAFFNPLAEDMIRRLRGEGHSLAEVAARAGTTVAVVRRLVGRRDRAAIRQRQQELARGIDAEPLIWAGKVARWRAETGLCGATLRRALKRPGGSMA